MADAAGRTETPLLAVYGDFVCPFSWMAEPVAERASDALGLSIRHHAYELRPLPAPHPDERYMRRLWEHGVLPIARSLGIEASFPSIRTRTRKAHEAAAFAEERGRGRELRAALYDAYFRGGRDIGRIDVLVELGEATGLDRTELKVALDVDQYTDRVVEDRERAARLGLTGVPAFVLHTADAGIVRVGWCGEDELRGWMEENLQRVRA